MVNTAHLRSEANRVDLDDTTRSKLLMAASEIDRLRATNPEQHSSLQVTESHVLDTAKALETSDAGVAPRLGTAVPDHPAALSFARDTTVYAHAPAKEDVDNLKAAYLELWELAKFIACGPDSGIDDAWITYRENAEKVRAIRAFFEENQP